MTSEVATRHPLAVVAALATRASAHARGESSCAFGTRARSHVTLRSPLPVSQTPSARTSQLVVMVPTNREGTVDSCKNGLFVPIQAYSRQKLVHEYVTTPLGNTSPDRLKATPRPVKRNSQPQTRRNYCRYVACQLLAQDSPSPQRLESDPDIRRIRWAAVDESVTLSGHHRGVRPVSRH